MHRARRRGPFGGVIFLCAGNRLMFVRFAILGARGLIGGAVVRRARLAGHQVRAVVRPGRETGGFPAGIEVVPADLRSRESVVEAVRGMDVVVHAANVPYPEWPRFVPLFAEGALAGRPCRWPLDADALHEFILNDDAVEAMLRLIRTPAAHGRAVHVPGPHPIVSRDFIRLAYAAAGSGEPSVRVFGRGMYRLVGLVNPMARAAHEMAYLFDDPVLLDGLLYRSLTGSPHPATPYEEGVRRTMEWFRSHRTRA